MKYLIYKITNKINGKFYIGKHQTSDIGDGYMGSGKLIKAAIKKYGVENFSKEILHIYDSEEDMNLKEKELVTISDQTYNLCEGGKGGFSYINRNGLNLDLNRELPKEKLDEARRLGGQNCRKKYGSGYNEGLRNSRGFKGKRHSEEWKTDHSNRMKSLQEGNKNSQYGTCWITNGVENKKIKKSEIDIFIPFGYYRGRI